MLCDRILDNLDSPTAATLIADRAVDYLDVTWADLHRRSVRLITRGGRRVGVLLALNVRLRNGDVIFVGEGDVIVVNHLPCDVLAGRPPTARQMGLVACELGNLHLPVEVGEGEIVTIPDGPAEAAFRAHGVPFCAENRRFSPLRASVLNNVRLAQDFQLRKG
jgi:urease accessory protein